MSRHTERAVDVTEYFIGSLIFSIVAALTAVVMAVGFGAIEAFKWLRHEE